MYKALIATQVHGDWRRLCSPIMEDPYFSSDVSTRRVEGEVLVLVGYVWDVVKQRRWWKGEVEDVQPLHWGTLLGYENVIYEGDAAANKWRRQVLEYSRADLETRTHSSSDFKLVLLESDIYQVDSKQRGLEWYRRRTGCARHLEVMINS